MKRILGNETKKELIGLAFTRRSKLALIPRSVPLFEARSARAPTPPGDEAPARSRLTSRVTQHHAERGDYGASASAKADGGSLPGYVAAKRRKPCWPGHFYHHSQFNVKTWLALGNGISQNTAVRSSASNKTHSPSNGAAGSRAVGRFDKLMRL